MTAYEGRRRYVFERHGRSEYFYHRRQRANRERTATLSCPTLQTITLENTANHERLIEAYDEQRCVGGDAPGVDGLTFDDLSRTEVAGVFRGIWPAIREGTYRPAPSRVVSIPKRRGGHRTLRVRTIFDRAVGKAIARALTPLLDPMFSNTVFGFRPGRSHLEMLATIEARMIATSCWVLAVDDVRKAFDHVPIDPAVSKYRDRLADTDLVNLIEIVLRGHEGKNRRRGIDQGCPFSPLTLNLFLNDTLDRPLEADREIPPLYRYVDNLVFVCSGATEGERVLQRARLALEAEGLELKNEDGPPVDVRQQGTNPRLFGLRIGYRKGRLSFELEDESWQDITEELEEAHTSNRPGQRARRIVDGWVTGHSPAFETDAEAAILSRMTSVLRHSGLLREVPEREVRRSIEKARQRWEQIRFQAQPEYFRDFPGDF